MAALDKAFFDKHKTRRRDWKISTNFTKGMLTGQRGVVVTVIHLPTRQTLKLSRTATTKANARLLAPQIAEKLIAKLAP